jgi:hypothetical protein
VPILKAVKRPEEHVMEKPVSRIACSTPIASVKKNSSNLHHFLYAPTVHIDLFGKKDMTSTSSKCGSCATVQGSETTLY